MERECAATPINWAINTLWQSGQRRGAHQQGEQGQQGGRAEHDRGSVVGVGQEAIREEAPEGRGDQVGAADEGQHEAGEHGRGPTGHVELLKLEDGQGPADGLPTVAIYSVRDGS